MKSKRKKIGLIGGIILTANIVVAASVIAAGGSFVAGNSETGYDLTLGAGDITTLTSEFNSDDFIKNTTAGNPIKFHYENGKAAANKLIELGKSQIAYSNYEKDYIGNVDAISGISNVSVKFSGVTNMFVYGSVDNVEFRKLDVVTSEQACDSVKNYRYIRFVNGAVETQSCVVEAISFAYSCSNPEHIDESMDLLNGGIKVDSVSIASYDTSVYNTDYDSTQSLKLNCAAGTNDARVVFNFGGKTVKSEDMRHMKFNVQVNCENTTAYDSGRNYFRILAYPAIGNNRNGNTAYFQLQINNGATGWSSITFDFSSLTSGTLKDNEVYDGIYLKIVYLKGTAYFDNGSLVVSDNYPAVSQEIYNKYEGNDLTNGTLVSHYGTGKVVGTIDTFCSTNSLQSIKTVNDQDWRLFDFNGSGLDTDLYGKVLTVDVYGISDGLAHAISYAMKFMHNSTYYTINLKAGVKGVTMTSINEWTRYTVDFTKAIDEGGATVGKAVSGDVQAGFQVGYARTAYFDNLTLVAQ